MVQTDIDQTMDTHNETIFIRKIFLFKPYENMQEEKDPSLPSHICFPWAAITKTDVIVAV